MDKEQATQAYETLDAVDNKKNNVQLTIVSAFIVDIATQLTRIADSLEREEGLEVEGGSND